MYVYIYIYIERERERERERDIHPSHYIHMSDRAGIRNHGALTTLVGTTGDVKTWLK